ncbi:DUF302 domain-containing protein [Jannaschia donghaensis]|uniref:DUF302 domain-containing protein n=1 Tax=Jannaschia donghaensis TaxID=420998 RepID=A0A0M6YGM6_9RHOB|nr:DUF302 domain-containing protein [Jannaschia donghaensis]CTQ48835.1 hypothetical protein JDO7802_00842 [Jannaschia donghaensis]
MIRTVTAAAAALTLALPVSAETLASPHSVAQTMDNLVAAVEGAGATVMARVDHTAGAASVDMDLSEAQLLVFGNPKVGTPIMQQDLRAGLVLPLRVLVHDSDDGTVIRWQSPEEMFAGLDVDLESEPVKMAAGALANLTAKAAE